MEKYACEIIDDYDYLAIRTTVGDKLRFLIMDNDETKAALTLVYMTKPKVVLSEDEIDR